MEELYKMVWVRLMVAVGKKAVQRRERASALWFQESYPCAGRFL